VLSRRAKALLLLCVLVASTSFSAAQPGGNGDGLRDMQCGGACHGDAGQNASSSLNLSIEFPASAWVGQPIEVTVLVAGVDVAHDEELIGLFLLSSTNANGDTPLDDGWEILSDGHGGAGNYVEITTDGSATAIEHTWVLRASALGLKTLYASVHHADATGPSQGRPFFGVSSGFEVNIVAVPEDLARLHPDFSPTTMREVGQPIVVDLHTQFTNTVSVECRTEDGALFLIDVNATAPDFWQFTLPAVLQTSTLEWRVNLAGEGPSQTTPWFSVGAQVTPEEVNAAPIYLQGVAMGLVLFGAVVALQRPRTSSNQVLKTYDATAIVESSEGSSPESASTQDVASLPEGGLPEGWTEEQWEWYGHEYLAGTYGGGVS
jgi:hypothetical protein